MLGQMKHNLESRSVQPSHSVVSDSKIAGRNINNLRYADDTTLMAESEEPKSLLMKVKEECEKVGLKPNIQKTKIMAYGPMTSWKIDGVTMETVRDYFRGEPQKRKPVTASTYSPSTCHEGMGPDAMILVF